MRHKHLLAAPALLLLSGCAALDPAAGLRDAARQLRFSLDRVTPRLELAFPLEQSRLVVDMDLGVENASGQRLRTRSVTGNVRLATGGAQHPIGSVGFPAGLDIAPQGHSTLHAQLSLSYSDIRAAWNPIRSAVVDHESATWQLQGQATFDILGIDFGVPFTVTKGTGH